MPTRAQVERALDRFRGTFEQVPPPFSAKKIGGVPAYRLARRGRPVTLDTVRVTVRDLRVVSYESGRLRVRVTASAGFYVRSLAHALGEVLGPGGCLESLRRDRLGDFTADDARSLESLLTAGPAAADFVVPLERLVSHFEAVVLTEPGARRAAHGNALGPEHLRGSFNPTAQAGLVRLVGPGGALLGLARRGQGPEVLRPAVVLV
jgi:tRNA pseudouridine55 synthase